MLSFLQNLKSLIVAGAVAAVIAGWIGYHFGSLGGEKQVAELKAAQAQAVAATQKAAADAQRQADADNLAQLQAALQNAQQAAGEQQRLARERQRTIDSLNNRMKSNEQKPSVAAWSAAAIPAGALDGMCFYTDSGPAAACQSNP